MKLSLSILVILFCTQVGAEVVTKEEQIAKAIGLCDAKIMQLCGNASNAEQGEMRSCVKDAMDELDAECRLLIDKEMRKGNLIEAKSAKSGKSFDFPDSLKKNN